MNETDENEWVMITDPEHVVRSCDQVRLMPGGTWSPAHESIGDRIDQWPGYEFRCRRKDLPAVTPSVHPMCAAMAECQFIMCPILDGDNPNCGRGKPVGGDTLIRLLKESVGRKPQDRSIEEWITEVWQTIDKLEIESNQPGGMPPISSEVASPATPSAAVGASGDVAGESNTNETERCNFRCPECGSSQFGTSNCTKPFDEWIGHCHGYVKNKACTFSWHRQTQDCEVMSVANSEDGILDYEQLNHVPMKPAIPPAPVAPPEPPPFRLEYGKRYVDRVGHVTAPLVKNTIKYIDTHPFWDSEYNTCYRENGRWSIEDEDEEEDLMAEYIEPVQVRCGGPHVAREVFERLKQAATVVRESFANVEYSLTRDQHKALVALGDVLREVE